jgi:PTS system ascorbate-specific IIA component
MSELLAAFGEDSILIREKVGDRELAIKIAGELLVNSGKVEPSYVQSMLDAVAKFGPYIVIAPGIALAHGKPGDDVIDTGLSLLVLKTPTNFEHQQNDPVSLVFGLAARDHESHISILASLAEVLSDQAKVDSLLRSKDSDQIRDLLA